MNEPRRKEIWSFWTKAWVALRFITFGVGGFLIMFGFSLAFIIRVVDPIEGEQTLNPLISLPLVFIGAVMMLFGVGQWRRWAYLWVFLSIPVAFLALALLPPSVAGSKDMGVVFLLCSSLCGLCVGSFFSCRSAGQNA